MKQQKEINKKGVLFGEIQMMSSFSIFQLNSSFLKKFRFFVEEVKTVSMPSKSSRFFFSFF